MDFLCTVTFSFFVDVHGKNYHNVLQFSKVIRQNIAVTFLKAVRNNVVSDDVTITSLLRSDVTE